MPGLFSPLKVKGMTIKNRLMMSPMCQYSVEARDGKPEEWHYVHYVSRAIGGTGLIMMEMTDIHPDGRITDRDLGLWSDEQIPAFQRIIQACQGFDAKVGIQLAHAGRKAESESLSPVAPSAIPFSDRYRVPHEMREDEIQALIQDFGKAAERAVQAGADTIELHGAHGYLIHQFISRLSNHRNDAYGDPNRFVSEVIRKVRACIPEEMPLLMRLSAVEYVAGGYQLDDTIERVRLFREMGVDMFDLSSGGEAPGGPSPVQVSSTGYQVPFADAVRMAVDVPVIAVGHLDDPRVADMVIQNELADIVAIGRGMLRNPYWANEAAITLGKGPILPHQYERAF
ncbi:NADH:flavin oxidoreductase/NADH oxidase [Marininema halotolerans]|uniref:2,4-dienoyl-CoA reductase n=1 Tax=Marininema halotolerans TaxID=1155944 RepID=A0A1I6PX97_9BACL|nr:NADH:flavin oxidoreductase/NADH oxidase [Marininema halotolerans]SFS44836.1 2,4-dienoyl-CoA reductase [Marininema halotolerans]